MAAWAGACFPGGEKAVLALQAGSESRATERDRGLALSTEGASVISASLEKRWGRRVQAPQPGHCISPSQGL